MNNSRFIAPIPLTRSGQNGFTLVEIAIVLVVIGLLLGGILKGQELVNNAKVRYITYRQSAIKTAWFGFIDRFAGLPGDHVQAHIYVTGAAAGDGDGLLSQQESPLVFQHLTAAGFLRCPQCTETSASVFSSASNSVVNAYGGVMSVWHDSEYFAVRSPYGTPTRTDARLIIHTGPRIPSNLLAEVDRKLDDGIPNLGDVVFSRYIVPSQGKGVDVGECVRNQADGQLNGTQYFSSTNWWRPASSNPPVWANCGAGIFL